MPLRLYAMLGAVIVFLAMGATIFWYRGEAISAQAAERQAKADLATAKGVNDANQETIGRMKALADAKDKLLADIAGQIADINANVAENTAAVQGLKDANEDVRAYLAGAVPPDLSLQLNK
ncbi:MULTISPECIES: hypothetical protein [unclassified Mesorhizobium]|uniref:hypothetical protein n=1 Tax=unclassified Mesorhizobium TaxID=325217 RepID=UPI000FDC31BF|nr:MULTISPECIES: hypothetical protein [unclassified Mesorhizobium]TGT76155.1 hypothetical protein EN809_000580 [Mesorhizobium sp. M2E.F.Ca.ET.166.01.1.1]TGW02270.1 hypothetical protein EN797_000580 [Mesorhizobium sp. M2E.F.Ca.ET.154.01.1.1]